MAARGDGSGKNGKANGSVPAPPGLLPQKKPLSPEVRARVERMRSAAKCNATSKTTRARCRQFAITRAKTGAHVKTKTHGKCYWHGGRSTQKLGNLNGLKHGARARRFALLDDLEHEVWDETSAEIALDVAIRRIRFLQCRVDKAYADALITLERHLALTRELVAEERKLVQAAKALKEDGAGGTGQKVMLVFTPPAAPADEDDDEDGAAPAG